MYLKWLLPLKTVKSFVHSEINTSCGHDLHKWNLPSPTTQSHVFIIILRLTTQQQQQSDTTNNLHVLLTN